MSDRPSTSASPGPAPAPVVRALTSKMWGWAESKFAIGIYKRGDEELPWPEAVEAQSRRDNSVENRAAVASAVIKRASQTTEFRWMAGAIGAVVTAIASALVLAPNALGHPAMWPALLGPVAIQAVFGFAKSRAYDKGVPTARAALVAATAPAETPPS